MNVRSDAVVVTTMWGLDGAVSKRRKFKREAEEDWGRGLMALTIHAASDLHTTGLLWTACADLGSVPT
jgi:hypothetical protein